jgi:hypothetical protein
MRIRPSLILVPLIASLVGCAAPGPAPRPADFPLHAADQPPFSLHWRLDRAPGMATAVGVLDIDGYVDRLADATVELQGLDAAGRVVSRARTRIEPRAFAGDAVWPFTLGLRPAGGEERFVVRVAEFNWRVMRPGGGR